MIRFVALILSVLLISGVSAETGEAVLFTREIAPLLVENCIACHSDDKAKGGYRVHTFEQLLVPGKSEETPIQAGKPGESELYQRLVTHDEDDRMPQKAEALPPEHIDLFRRWIEQGATLDQGKSSDPLVELLPKEQHPVPPDEYPRPLPILSLAVDPKGTTIAANGYHEITLWDFSGKLVRRITNVAQRVYALAFHPDGNAIAAAGGKPGRGGELSIYGVSSGATEGTLLRTADEILAVAFDPSGQLLAGAGTDNSIHIFDVRTRKKIRSIEQHSDWVTALDFSSDGKRLASASRDRTARVYAVETGELEISYSEHGLPLNSVAFLPDGQVMSGGRESRVRIWKIEDAETTRKIGGYDREIHDLVPAGESFFTASADRLVRQYATDGGKLIRKLDGHEAAIFALAANLESGRLVSGSYDGVVKIWRIADGVLLNSFIAAPGFPPNH